MIIATLTRLSIGGQGAWLGSLLIIICAGLSVMLGHVTRKNSKRTIVFWIALSLIACFPIGLGFALITPDTPYTAFVRLIFTLATILLFGKLMEAEKRRFDREQELDRAAGLDFLAQLPNRRALTAHLSSSKLRDNEPRAYLMIDIDHFKAINDEHGHLVGDSILREIGSRLQSAIRDEDYAARVGGEEFAIVLCVTDPDEARRIAERIRSSISQKFTTDEKTFSVTASLGGVFVEDGRMPPLTAFNLADQALYNAKRAGRDRAFFSTGNLAD